MNKKKADLYTTLVLLVAIVAASIYLLTDTTTSIPSLLPEQPAQEPYIPERQITIAPPVEPEIIDDTPALFDGVTITLTILAIVGVTLLVAAMKVTKKRAQIAPVATANQTPTTELDFGLFAEPVATTPAPPRQRPLPFFPMDIYEAINGVLSSRGGQSMEGPNFFVEADRCAVNPLAWVLGFDYRDGRDPKDTHKYTIDLQSRLCKAGYDTNIRIDAKRCIIEVENPNPPIFKLRQYWNEIKALPQNERSCIPGVEARDGKIALKAIYKKGERAGTMIAGRTGSGKTQVMLSDIITTCLLNTPLKMALIIADIKGDTKPLEGLPHLAMPILTEVNDIVVMLQAVVAEMGKRQRMAAKGDRSFNGKAISIYLDEVTTTLIQAGDYAKQISENIQQLTLVGRSLGIIVTMATQRIYDLPDAAVYSNCGRRFGLKLNTAQDSYALTGAQGTRLNDLRGRGAFEIFDAGNSEGERGQGFFVADPEEEGYTEELQWYVNEICRQWSGLKSYYTLELPDDDDHDTETPRPVKKSWTDDDYDGFGNGFGNAPGSVIDDFTPESNEETATTTTSKEDTNAAKILEKYQPEDLFDMDGNILPGMLTKAIRAIYGNETNTSGGYRTNTLRALDLIRKWHLVAIEGSDNNNSDNIDTPMLV